MSTLSVVISAYNEEDTLGDCLASVGFADEVIVVNNESSDKTAQVAKKHNAIVYTIKNNLMLNINKNFGFGKAKGKWILNLDADERVSPELKDEIQSVIDKEESEIVGFWIPRKNIIFGKWVQSDMWWPDHQLRLFRNGKGKFPEKHVHEYIAIDGRAEKLQYPLIHQSYSSVSQFLQKMDRIYTENEVKVFLSSGKKVDWIDALRYPANDFLKTFFAQKGYRDGLHGFVLSMLQAFYSEVVFAKIWEKQGFPEEGSKHFMRYLYKEFRYVHKSMLYWFYTAFINEAKHPLEKLRLRFWRKSVKHR